jgi:hypothetical protein
MARTGSARSCAKLRETLEVMGARTRGGRPRASIQEVGYQSRPELAVAEGLAIHDFTSIIRHPASLTSS